MTKRTTPLFVIVDDQNVARETAETMAEARQKRDANGLRGVKLFSDHKGDKSHITY